MSIPKEPRQLMINIMYLVLTALLALNVSAEIFNAFKIVDKGLVKSNSALDVQNANLPKTIKESAKKKESLQVYADKVDDVTTLGESASKYVENIIDSLIINSGGYLVNKETGELSDELKGKKNKDITTRWLVNDGRGEDLKKHLETTRAAFLAFIDDEDKAAKEKDIAISIDDKTWVDNKKESWSQMNFNHMPVQATIPIFRKYINDIKSTESMVLNYLAGKVGLTNDVVFSNFKVVAAPKKSYVIKGDPYEADVFLAASAGEDSKTGVSISINGSNVAVDADGVAKYKTVTSATGPKKYTARATVTNPVTGEVETVEETFEYEVGQRSVAVEPLKMNVFYIGVDNPVGVTAAGVNSNDVKVSMGGSGGGTIKRNGDGTYTVNVTRPTLKGEFAKVNVSAPGLNDSRDFRVKPIPTPVAKLSLSRGGNMGNGEFKAQQSVRADLENFDFDVRCDIKGYRLVRAAKRQDPEITTNIGGGFTGDSRAIINKATPGDRYFFENIKCTCPGDVAPRDLGSMTFIIG